MIPKIAWFHWEGEMSWLREQSIHTFEKHNPDWEVNLVGTHHTIEEYGYEPWHSGDWTKWKMLARHGGFSVDTDTVTLAPIPDEWLDCDLCAQIDAFKNVEQMAIIGATPENPLFVEADRRCSENPPRSYQSFGVDLLRHITDRCIYEHRGEPGRFGVVRHIPREAYCFYDFGMDPFAFWLDEGPTHKPLPERRAPSVPTDEWWPYAIGVHWYGGHEESKRHERDANPDGTSWLERLAREA